MPAKQPCSCDGTGHTRGGTPPDGSGRHGWPRDDKTIAIHDRRLPNIAAPPWTCAPFEVERQMSQLVSGRLPFHRLAVPGGDHTRLQRCERRHRPACGVPVDREVGRWSVQLLPLRDNGKHRFLPRRRDGIPLRSTCGRSRGRAIHVLAYAQASQSSASLACPTHCRRAAARAPCR